MNRSNLWLNYDSKADSGFTDFTDPWFSHDMNSCQSFLCPPDPSLRPLYPMDSCNYPDNFSDPWDENHSWLIRLLLSASVRFFCNCVFHGVYALFENVKIQFMAIFCNPWRWSSWHCLRIGDDGLPFACRAILGMWQTKCSASDQANTKWHCK